MAQLSWELLQQVFTTETIMTAGPDLLTWEHGTDLAPVRAEAESRRFDVVPVTEDGRIVGVLCEEGVKPEDLTDRWLVSRDTGIPDLVTILAESGRPALLVFHRQDVIGMVAPADLNKMPARVYFYNLIGELELVLAEFIRSYWTGDPEDLLLLLSKKRREKLTSQASGLVEGNVNVDPIQLFYLSDLVEVVAKSEGLRSELGFASRGAAADYLNGLVDLRDKTMHLVRPLLERVPEDLYKLHERVERAKHLLEQLNEGIE